ncbi:hypothetical protein [Brucella gallinifaecis]|uniref:hypothetical protein n=1 Tax=Brucella gallinifaecis TaxID=215590 RepID=UPI0023625765|nr:hypothetical protein [Brucella gallinifaecis]
MKKIKFIIIVSFISFIVGGLFSKFENGTYYFWKPADQFEFELEKSKSIDPRAYHVISDHKEEFRKLYSERQLKKENSDGENAIANRIDTHLKDAIYRASDEDLISYFETSNRYYSTLLFHDPKSCILNYTNQGLSPEALANKEISTRFAELELKEVATYLSGRNGTPKPDISDDLWKKLIVENIRVTAEDADILDHPNNYDGESVCAAILKIYDISKIPREQQAAYLRRYFKP